MLMRMDSASVPAAQPRPFRVLVCDDQPDVLVIYSDGVTEAETESGEEFSEERLVRVVRENAAQPAGAVVEAIIDEVTRFSHGSRHDDVTVVALRGL